MRWTSPVASGLTYSLGKSLYVPITSRCNTLTLPVTRGSNFKLPPEVVASLCRMRDCEQDTTQWKHWCIWLDTQESNQKLPKPPDTVAFLSSDEASGRPTVHELFEQVLKAVTMHKTGFDAIVIAGEGEPTLRLTELLELVQQIKQDDTTGGQKSGIVRVTTNGLVATDDCAAALHTAGVDAVSVALMTHDPTLYDELMQPPQSSREWQAHARVCSFVQQAVKVGMKVEITAVDREEVNKPKTEALAASLGVQAPVRWRSYYP